MTAAHNGPGQEARDEGPDGTDTDQEGPDGGEPVGAGAPAGGPSEPDLLPDITALETQRDEYLVALQRLQADFENYRKRVQRQQEETAARAAVRLVKELLPALDVLDLARAHLAVTTGESGEPELSSDGQALVQAQSLLLGSLEKEGLVRLDAPDVPFDPSVHDAVAHAPDDEGAEGGAAAGGPVVDEVLRAGYVWQGQTLRPAMVRVRG